ncbi:hypothetical protein [Streptomyces scabiei]|uniref:hypothetical protein n=1 Tax=Streptomyces scabiei TaxID=1930 RepID=UPI0007660350|nr:hypothetical protein [Streptomyces scabiei]
MVDAETGIAVCATVIALVSLWISLVQTKAAREHNRQSVRPLLQIRRIKDDVAGLEIINAGLGPAIVTKTLVTFDGENVGAWDLETYHRVTRSFPFRPKVMTLVEGQALIPGQKRYLLHVDGFKVDEHNWFWELISQRMLIEVRYESLYGGEDFSVRLSVLQE